MIGNTYLELKLLHPKSFMKNKVTKRLPKLSNKESYFTLLSNTISNSTKYNLSKSFHGQISLRNTIFSVLISGVKLLLIHNWLKKCSSDG